jgi:pimeloyl-ACP methyl ester carboxylesterase
MTVAAGDGLLLKGILAYPDQSLGSTSPLAVLAHQYPATADSFSPLVEDLLDLGVAVLAFDQRGHGASTTGPSGPVVIDTPVGFTQQAFGAAFMSSIGKVGLQRIDEDILRVASWGAAQNFVESGRMVLVGASIGGTGVTLAAPQVPGLRALVTLGPAGERVWGPDGRDRGRRAMEQISAATLHATSEHDPFQAAQNARAWSDGLAHARSLIVPGSAHAMAIYYAVREPILSLISRSLAS